MGGAGAEGGGALGVAGGRGVTHRRRPPWDGPIFFPVPHPRMRSTVCWMSCRMASGHVNRTETELCPSLVFQQLPGLTLPFLCPLPLSTLRPALDLEDLGLRCETLNKSVSP